MPMFMYSATSNHYCRAPCTNLYAQGMLLYSKEYIISPTQPDALIHFIQIKYHSVFIVLYIKI